MRTPKRVVAVILAGLTAASVPVRADDHLLGARDVAAQLAQAAEARRANLAAIIDVLASPTVVAVASGAGVDAEQLRARLGQLSDAEAAQLAVRAAALQADPVAGRLSGGQITLIVIAGVLLFVAIVLLAVVAGCDANYDYCY